MQLWRVLIVICIAGVLGACANGARNSNYVVATKGPYALDTGDVLRVTVYGDEELSDLYRVDDRGMIAFPLVGPIMARGGTTQQASGKIAAALANGYMRSPNVAVEVAEYRPFFIEGEVGNSGQYPYVYGMTVRAAIATAGGFTQTANRDKAIVYRRQGRQMVKGEVNMDFPIYPGDTIVIEDRWL